MYEFITESLRWTKCVVNPFLIITRADINCIVIRTDLNNIVAEITVCLVRTKVNFAFQLRGWRCREVSGKAGHLLMSWKYRRDTKRVLLVASRHSSVWAVS